MPVRKPKKNYRSLTGMFYSLKNNKGIFFESKLERDLFLTLEFNKNVIKYEEQPLALNYKKENRTYPYTPDCLVHYVKDRPTVLEVKYSEEIEADKEVFKYKFDQITNTLKEKGYAFKMFTEKDLDEIALENMNFIYNYVTIKDQSMINETYQKLQLIGSAPYTEILSKLSLDRHKQAIYIPYIWYLVLTGKLDINMYEKISPQTYIKVLS